MSVVAAAVDPMLSTYRRWPVEFERGSGSTLYDADGRPYLDLVAGLAVASVGHAHPDVTAAIARQAARLVHVSNLYTTAPQRDLAYRLMSLSGGMRSFFCNSGAEAVECGIKLARKWGGPQRRGIVAARGGFHGRTLGALSVTGQPSKADAFEPLLPRVTHVAFDDVDALERVVGDDAAALIVEPIQGEAGIIVPHGRYLAEVRELCDRAGCLLIVDEVQTGVGRTGSWFAFEATGIVPDIVCVAKGLGGGLPIGACLAVPPVAEAFAFGDHGSTFGGGPVQSAAALAVLDVIEREGLLERARVAGARLRDGLGSIFGTGGVRGRGLLLGVALGSDTGSRLAAAALQRGVLVNDVAPDVIRICPPLVISDDEIERGLDLLEEAWDEVRKA
ncbi:MAG: acetylornithine transaminase [Actinomycetota bacterium]|nr:acetylornithine transaminase [Actinomycetota bacterium]